MNLPDADPTALRMTNYYERREAAEPEHADNVAEQLVRLTAGRHLVGNVPSFDAAMLDGFLRRSGLVPAWHYHLVDVEAMVAGHLGLGPPWESRDLSRRLGVAIPEGKDEHTALADARWAKAMYEAVLRPR